MSSFRQRTKPIGIIALAFALLLAAPMVSGDEAHALISCSADNTVRAEVVVLDTPIFFNRLGAQNVNYMTYALRRDVVKIAGQVPLNQVPDGDLPGLGGTAIPQVEIRKDKRVRPLVLRVNAGQCLDVKFWNLLTNPANQIPQGQVRGAEGPFADEANQFIDDQVKGRYAGFMPTGLQLVNANSFASNVGDNANTMIFAGDPPITYRFYAEREGAFIAYSYGHPLGGEASGGNVGTGMFAAVNVEPPGAVWFRSQVTEEEMRLAASDTDPTSVSCGTVNRTTGPTGGHPIIDYDAIYPEFECDGTTPTIWVQEGKANLPIIRMTDDVGATGAKGKIVHADLNGIIAHRDTTTGEYGNFPPSTYPLENDGKNNPTVPNRLEPFREFTSIFHDEQASIDAFPDWFADDSVTGHVTHGVRDSFMINYGSGGIGSEIIANRLGVGPMYDCLGCAYEEFFLTSFTVGDPAMVVDIPANTNLEKCGPDLGANCADDDVNGIQRVGPKATKAFYPDDSANVHHSYIGDFAKFRNTHAGPKEQHVFHLHNHQWLFNANDDNANYQDAQGIGPGSGYTYEINFGGSGNRNKSAGDAIYHCHFYPHFAQGMWHLWRIHDVFEAGTQLQVTAEGVGGFHDTPFDLFDGTPEILVGNRNNPQVMARALPDGEILAGVPIPAVVPLPGKPMPPMPGEVQIVTKDVDGDNIPDSSQANVVDRPSLTDIGTMDGRNPGYPFWIAGVDCGGNPVNCDQGIVGQRPTTPPLDMLTETEAATLRNFNPLFGDLIDLNGDVNGGWDGGLERHALDGVKAAGVVPASPPFEATQTTLDFSKDVKRAKPVWYPEGGTDLEQALMAFNAQKFHDTFLPDGNPATGTAGFRTNGAPPQPSAPYFEPCVDDDGDPFLKGQPGQFFDGIGGKSNVATPQYGADSPRIYKAANIQFDAVFNKVGYHYPQQRIIALWQDVLPTINKLRPPEPLVMRLNSFDCAMYLHTNLVPREFELDDYQVQTPTDIIGQHIHLPKWDLVSADGAANGWNYEDGTLSPGAVEERIVAINAYNSAFPTEPAQPLLHADLHPFFGDGGGVFPEWEGARTTIQRWFADPVYNVADVDRGLGIIFTHDHYGPSTHQQIGLYATVLIEPAGSEWKHNETGVALGSRPDGGPTSWQAVIEPRTSANGYVGTIDPAFTDPYREFYFEFSDFQHAYEPGIYIGAGPDGRPNGVAPFGDVVNGGTLEPGSFRFAINPSVREEAVNGPGNPSVFPDIVRYPPICPNGDPRPCPEAISADDPGMLVVNYRNDPVGLRVFDPRPVADGGPVCPDGNPGCQAEGQAGDLAFALHSGTTRAIPELNAQPIPGVLGGLDPFGSGTPTNFPPTLNSGLEDGDPYTPMMRTFDGDLVKVKIQAGGHEHEHNATIHGVKWIQGNSGFGPDRLNSGWRNAQNDGISEQFNFSMPVARDNRQAGNRADYAYTMDASQDGWWSGTWGLIRSYSSNQNDLEELSNNDRRGLRIDNDDFFDGVCPTVLLDQNGDPITIGQGRNATTIPAPIQSYDVIAVLANDVLGKPAGVTIIPADASSDQHMGRQPNENGGTLVYNSRSSGTAQFNGPLHDPTTIMYVYKDDVVFDTACMATNPPSCRTDFGDPIGLLDGTPVEPIVLRANAGDCIETTLHNALLAPATILLCADGTLPDETGACADASLPEAVIAINVDGNPVFINDGQDLFVDQNSNGVGDVAFCPAGTTEVVDGTGSLIDCLAADGTTLLGVSTELVLAANVDFDRMPDLAGFNTLLQVVIRDRDHPMGPTTFQNNLIAPSAFAGIHPQLVEYDVTRDDGLPAGLNNPGQNLAEPGGKNTSRWYAGDIRQEFIRNQGNNRVVKLIPTPIEFGGSNLTPADKIKQGQKGMVGALIIEPEGSQWPVAREDLELRVGTDPNADTVARKTRASATIVPGTGDDDPLFTPYRDFATIYQKGLNLRHANSTAVPNIAGEGGQIPEDSHDAGQKAINYATEPMWFRFGLAANTPFGNAMAGLGAVNNGETAYSNSRTGGDDPVTPVFMATPGQPVRLRLLQPTGVGRGTTFNLHGHLWARDPYLAGVVPSQFIASGLPGDENPIAFYLGAQESVTPSGHFDIVLPSAGGKGPVVGDYLFNDQGSFGNTDGLWGIMRVQTPPSQGP